MHALFANVRSIPICLQWQRPTAVDIFCNPGGFFFQEKRYPGEKIKENFEREILTRKKRRCSEKFSGDRHCTQRNVPFQFIVRKVVKKRCKLFHTLSSNTNFTWEITFLVDFLFYFIIACIGQRGWNGKRLFPHAISVSFSYLWNNTKN